MMEKRYIEFESMTGIDENNRMKIELGTDHLNGMRFTLNQFSLSTFRSLFSIVDYFTLLKPAQYDISRIDYKDWYANEIVRRVTADSSHFERQSDAKKEVLSELVQRRNKLVNRVDKVMSFYHDNKDKIDGMEKIRANQQKFYPGPMVVYNKKTLMFENCSEYGDIYYHLSLAIDEDPSLEENKPGYGWMEYSKVFSESMRSLIAPSSENIIITNSKPRSDMRVLRRGDQDPSHLLKLSSKYYELFYSSSLIFSFYKLGLGSTISIAKPAIFSLVDKVSNQMRSNKNINFTIAYDPKYELSVSVASSDISMQVNSEISGSIQFVLNSSVLLSLGDLIHLVDECQITDIGYNLGQIFHFMLGDGELQLLNNPHNSSQDRYLRQVLVNYFKLFPSIGTTQLDDRIFSGKYQHHPQGELYPREIKEYTHEMSDREGEAHIIVTHMSEYFTSGDSSVAFSFESIHAELAIDDWHNSTWSCNCGNFHEYFKCRHLLACLIIGYKEGVLFA